MIAMATFLRLPLEVREKIYREVLPFTSSKLHRDDSAATWRLGDMALLATCRHVYEECVSIVYGENIFTLVVDSAATVFIMPYVSRYGKMRQHRVYDFYVYFTDRIISRMKRIEVSVNHYADFTSMTKYDCGGRALNHVLRSQVEALVDVLDRAEPLRWMQIRFTVSNGQARGIANAGHFVLEGEYSSPAFLQNVLLPFSQLSHVRDVAVTGAVTTEFAKALEYDMSRALWFSPTCY